VDTKAEKRKENAAKENGAAETASPAPESKTTEKTTEKKSVPNAIHLVRRADYLSEWDSWAGESGVTVTHPSVSIGGVIKEYEENYVLYLEQQARAKQLASETSGPSNAVASSSTKHKPIAAKPKATKAAAKARAPTPTWTESEDDGQ